MHFHKPFFKNNKKAYFDIQINILLKITGCETFQDNHGTWHIDWIADATKDLLAIVTHDQGFLFFFFLRWGNPNFLAICTKVFTDEIT